MADIDPGTRFRTRRDVVSVKRGELMTLLDVERSHFYSLNPLGGDIWELACDGLAVDSIVHRLGDRWDAPPDRLLVDTVAFLRRLTDENLLKVV